MKNIVINKSNKKFKRLWKLLKNKIYKNINKKKLHKSFNYQNKKLLWRKLHLKKFQNSKQKEWKWKTIEKTINHDS